MQISISDLKNGGFLLVDNNILIITEVTHVKPGKGAAFVRCRLKNLKTDLTIERTFRGVDRLEEVYLEEKTLQYTYRVGNTFHFMDQKSYEQAEITSEQIGDLVKYLQENMDVTAVYYNDQLQRVYLPNFITANIVETEPGFKGDSSRAGTKPATIDTGAVVQVPLFINRGEWVKIDTRNGQYVERVNK